MFQKLSNKKMFPCQICHYISTPHKLSVIIFTIIYCGALCTEPEVLKWKFCDKKYDITDSGTTYKHVCCHPEDYRPDPAVRTKCRANIDQMDTFRKVMLDMHNNYRALTAEKEFNGARPGSNINALSYDLNLEYVAWCNVMTCTYAHDKNHKLFTIFRQVGQNIARVSGKSLAEWNLSTGVRDWYIENKFLKDHQEMLDKFSALYVDNQEIAHYTAMVWWCATHIGCARGFWYEPKRRYNTHYLVCNYASNYKKCTINLFGAPVYKKGAPCSECSAGKSCNKEYKFLCGNVDPIPTGWIPDPDVGIIHTTTTSTTKPLGVQANENANKSSNSSGFNVTADQTCKTVLLFILTVIFLQIFDL